MMGFSSTMATMRKKMMDSPDAGSTGAGDDPCPKRGGRGASEHSSSDRTSNS
jgi:hypothetical protein